MQVKNDNSANAGPTTAPIQTGDTTATLPEFGRLRDTERLFGLKRGVTYRLIAEGKIKSVTLREPGNKFGCRLIHLQSVRDYLHGLMGEQNNEVTK